jgi:acyl-coenzyme A thioesterase PaaI-like protein
VFGVMLDVEQTAPGLVSGRCFIKQDHQGAERGAAHEGVIAAALSEAMALACGLQARARSIEVEFDASAAVGAFLEVRAQAQGPRASATATAEGVLIARASGSYDR